MKPLILVPPAQAEALFDALEECSHDRFSLLPWQDDDSPEEAAPPARAGAQSADGAARLHPLPQRRAA